MVASNTRGGTLSLVPALTPNDSAAFALKDTSYLISLYSRRDDLERERIELNAIADSPTAPFGYVNELAMSLEARQAENVAAIAEAERHAGITGGGSE